MLPITILTSGLLGIIFVVLTMRVIKQRGASKISLGDGGDELMIRRIRGQGNFIEYTPLFLILLMLAEMHGFYNYVLAIIAAIYVLARMAHGYALSFSEHNRPCRFYGTVFTGVTLISMCVINLYIGILQFI